QFPQLSRTFEHKHTVNMGQVYAFGYQQRHPEWVGNPWVGYQDLMIEHFGSSRLSLGEMIRANPRAVWDHFLWNLMLTPNGLQVLLFNATSGHINPDYPPVQDQRPYALLLSLLLIGVWIGGLIVLLRRPGFWWRAWLRTRFLGWVGMLAVAV